MNAAAGLAALAVALAPVSAVAPAPFDALAPVLAPAAGDPLDAALDGDRSLLSFLPDDVRSGHYTMPTVAHPSATGRVKPAQRRSGVFWRTESGNAYTRVEPYDEELVRREVGALADHFRRKREEGMARARANGKDVDKTIAEDPADYEKLAPLHVGVEPYGGSEYQWPFWKLFVRPLVPDLGNKVFTKDEGCSGAVDAFHEAVRAEVNALEPGFRPSGTRERWTVAIAPLRVATEDEAVAALRACGRETESSGYDVEATAVVVERWQRGVAYRLQTDVEGETGATTITVTPGDVGPPPAVPDPAPNDAPYLDDFLMAVAACRALPWEYSNFAASDSFHAPYSGFYSGPSPMFRSEWVCDADVPPGDRDDG